MAASDAPSGTPSGTPSEPASGAAVTPAARHRRIAGAFTDRVHATADWDAPTPVAEWRARDVVRHLVEWLPGLLSSGAGLTLPSGPGADDDPVAAWAVHTTAVQALLDDPATADLVLSNPHFGEVPVDQGIDRFYTSDVLMHTWDLARAGGLDDRLDPAECAALLAGMEPMDEVLRTSGQYGPRVPTAPDADARTRLIAFIGRDPEWKPPRR